MRLVYKINLLIFSCLFLVFTTACTKTTYSEANSEISYIESTVGAAVTDKSIGSVEDSMEESINTEETEQHSDEVITKNEESIDTEETAQHYDEVVFENNELNNLPQLKAAINRVYNEDAYNYDASPEQIAARLMDRNMICAYMFCTECLFSYCGSTKQDIGIPDENGYYTIDFLLFDNYSEFESFVRGTYSAESSDVLLYNFIGNGPTFTEQGNSILYNPNNTGFTTGPYFSDGYIIDNVEVDNNICNFTYSPILDNLTEKERGELFEFWGEKDFSHNCQMIFENGKWLLSYMVSSF